MRKLIAGTSPGFIVGEDADFQEWIVHLSPPRFAAKVRPVAEFTDAEMADGEQNMYFFGDMHEQEALVEFVWIDPQPDDADLEKLLSRAADFIEEMSDE